MAEATPALAALLAACPRVKALVTSRAALHVRGEQEFAVPPLDTPDLARLPALEDLAQYAAVALFVRQAQAVRPTFTLTPALAPTVAAITVRLDGLPLAIELAAARIKLLSPQMLLDRLDASLSLLTRGPIDLPERHQTMRRAIAWSHELLEEPEQRLFRRLAVFVGGWALEAAEAVCAESDGDAPCILDRLAALVDKSLVVSGEDASGEPRFRLLELIRDYGLGWLAAAGEEAAIRRRHADYYVAYAETAKQNLHSDAQAAWFARLSQEHANLRAALRWAEETGAIKLGLHLGAQLWCFWQVCGFKQEGRHWLERLLALQRLPETDQEMTLRAEALRAAGNLAWSQGDYEPAARLLEDSLALYRRVGSSFGEAHALATLGLIADERGECDAAVALFEEALALFHTLPNKTHVAMVYSNLASSAQGREPYATAIELYEKSLELVREAGDRWSVATTLGNLGWALQGRGDLTRAATVLGESLALFEDLGDKEGMAFALDNLSDLVHEQGDLKRAVSLQRQSLALAREVGAKRAVCSVLDGAAELAHELGQPLQAARLFALSSELRERAQMPRTQRDRARCESRVALVCASLGEVAFAAAWEAGPAMTLDEAGAVVAAVDDFATMRAAGLAPFA